MRRPRVPGNRGRAGVLRKAVLAAGAVLALSGCGGTEINNNCSGEASQCAGHDNDRRSKPESSAAPPAPTTSEISTASPTSAPDATQRPEKDPAPGDAPRGASKPPTTDPDKKDPQEDRSTAEDPVRLYNRRTGKCLAIAYSSTKADEPAIQWPCSTSKSQLWTLEPVSGGYRVRNLASGHCLANGYDSPRGKPVIQRPCGRGDEQVWVQDDLKRLKNRNSALCLVIPYSDTTDAIKAIQWTCSENTDQQWEEWR
ncbi:hypothetical protein SipoB123_44240 [Streptomyces ipomoeae]|nr:hypothetical protein SipoB123_44240 [Streptomyces ipomoeae]